MELVSVAIRVQVIGWLSIAALTVGLTGAAAQNAREYSTGLVFDSDEALAAIPSAKVYRDWYPDTWDLSEYIPDPGNQGSQGSCVGWAVAYAARTFHHTYENEVSPDSRQNIASPAALYNAVKVGGCADGSVISTALNYLKTTGISSLSDAPYDDQSCNAVSANEGHEKFRIKDFHVLRGSSGSYVPSAENGRIQAKIFRGQPVVIGLNLPENFFDYQSGIFNYRPDDEFVGRHAMTIVGYDDNRRAFKLINSWGQGWGEAGYMWLSYDAVPRLINSAFIMETVPVDDRPQPPPYQPPIIINDDETIDLLSDFEQEVKALTSRFECAGFQVADKSENTIVAHAKTEPDRATLQKTLEDAFDGVKAAVKTVPWPQCEALKTFAKPLRSPEGLTLELVGPEPGTNEPVMKGGDPFVMKIRTPDYPSYIYATYLQSDDEGKHEAIHLIQTVDPLRQYAPGSEIIIGDGRDRGPKFTIQGPNFGLEMIVLIASASPLYSEERPLFEIERNYLSSFKDLMTIHIKDKSERRISAQVLTLTTKPKE